METVDQYLTRQESGDSEEAAIELLAEQLMKTAIETAGQVLMASTYNVTAADRWASFNTDEFNEVYYAIAKKLIDSDRGYV